jgi:lipid-A-disaccharide synthase-like uncharacterized protein
MSEPPLSTELASWLNANLNVWVLIGLVGQCMFMMRFVIQWIASERVKKSVVPDAFWYFSLAGGLIVLAYAVHKKDIVFVLGQGAGIFIYIRNIYFIRRHKNAT